MKVNPETMSWTAPTTNVDGTEITYALEYEVGLDQKGIFSPIVTIPGQLQPDNRYTAPIADLPLEYGEHTIALRSFAKEAPDRVSEWSEPVTFVLSAEIPRAPLDLRVT
ncbi:hypothetical protein GCM10011533_30170 [Streptosporangium jomthongense]|uniref:Uncharacterized protein n=1 Tax=Marinobacter aromaticivorans TaxID=1494078 RepID=A0ABW2IZA8_9GAMM|nr:hypothetical protein [Marinobacter aromaticivorans]GGE75794.1 hypothetical protein GCM10011533_30170 [Streptosporangium jomthongense]